MKTTVYKLHGAATSTTNALATLTVQRAGRITALYGIADLNATAHGTTLQAELSFVPTGQLDNSDVRGVLFEVAHRIDLNTSGAVSGIETSSLSGIAIPVNAGDRLYLNVKLSGSPASGTRATFYIYVTE